MPRHSGKTAPRKRGHDDDATLLVERDTELEKRRRPQPCPVLLAPLESSVVSLEAGEAKETRLDRASVALVAAGTPYRVRAVSPVTSLVTWLVAPRARELACREYPGHVLEGRFTELLASSRVLPRTRWVDELVHRYVFEREVCEKHTSRAAVFLETELAKELYFLCKERDEAKTRASVVHEEGDLVSRARARIDANLFSPLRVADLAAHCHASESTLVRAFRRELGHTPKSFARERRLDAALLLVQSGRYRIGEVAERVGYSNFAAFSSAFRKRFGATPSALRGGDGELDVLPPHGGPAGRGSRVGRK
jgi:AraC-like DNA-binding protein